MSKGLDPTFNPARLLAHSESRFRGEVHARTLLFLIFDISLRLHSPSASEAVKSTPETRRGPHKSCRDYWRKKKRKEISMRQPGSWERRKKVRSSSSFFSSISRPRCSLSPRGPDTARCSGDQATHTAERWLCVAPILRCSHGPMLRWCRITDYCYGASVMVMKPHTIGTVVTVVRLQLRAEMTSLCGRTGALETTS